MQREEARKMKRCVFLACVVSALGLWSATVTVVAPQTDAAASVTVGGRDAMEYAAGKSAPLKATAGAGWSFAGWYGSYDEATGAFSNEVVLAQSADWRTPAASYVVGDDDVTLYARFVKPKDDRMSFDLFEIFDMVADDVDTAGRPVLLLTNAIDAVVSFDSLSLPVVTIAGLPPGLSFDGRTLTLSGAPTTPGVYKVVASAKNASGHSFSQIFYVRVENEASEYVYGNDAEISVGEEVDEYLEEFFGMYREGAEVKSVRVTGLPTGLSFVTETEDGYTDYYIQGTASKAGEYLVKCTVIFTDNTVWTASMLFTVADLNPADYDGNVDFAVLEGHAAGDVILEEDEVAIGEYDNDGNVGVTAVSGLPPGIEAVRAANEYGGYSYILKGMFSKAGEYTVSVKVTYEDWETEEIATATLSRKIVVGDSPGVYLAAEVLDPEDAPGCNVSGGGVYTPGASARLTATAGRDYVFAGWCDAVGAPRLTGADDYRKPAAAVPIMADDDLEWLAAFIPKADDSIDVGALDGMEIVVDTEDAEKAEFPFVVDSGSLPTLKFKNLPAGMTCAPSADMPGEYVLSYDPATVKSRPKPGRYAVTATGTNVSRASDAADFTVTILNYKDEDIHVENDYGVLTPNVAMTPISFSNAVDFARGDTLAVSGLPAGLKYNDRSAPFMLSGTPTKPGDYTLTFAAKIVVSATTNAQGRVTNSYRTGTATAFVSVKDFPAVAAILSEDAEEAGNKVTGGGSFKAGTKVTLKATPAKDWTFAGWSGVAGVDGLAALNPSLAYVIGTNDLTEINAEFLHKRDDVLFVDDPGVVAVARGEAFTTNLVADLISTRSLPTVSVTGLPGGLRFDAKTFLISGTVGRTAKSGYAYATVSAKNASGYTFVRVVKFVVLENASDEIPDEPQSKNEANIDFSDLDGLATGGYCPADGLEGIGFAVDPSESGSDVTAISVSGLPSGLKPAVSIEDGAGTVVVYGTPNKPGRFTVKVQVTYADRKRATSEHALVVEDGGSGWLDVESFDGSMGTVSGSGVYASGATVRLGARPAAGNVFAGWHEDEEMPFDVVAATDGVDFRTAAASFVFRKDMFSSASPALYGGFVAKDDDGISVSGLDETWEIDPAEDCEQAFAVDSASLPRLTATGLPKGVTLDAAQGRFVYSAASRAQIAPGYYTVALKAVNQSNAAAAIKFSVFVANKTTDAIAGLSPEPDAYPIFAGVALDPELILPEVDASDGWKLTVSGLPAGLKLVQDGDTKAYSVSGIATRAATNTVVFTAAKGTRKEVATITVGVAALPAWAYGTYDGAYFTFAGGETNAAGQITLTVSAAGKASGKLLTGGKTYSFSAPAFDRYDAETDSFIAPVSIPWAPNDKEEWLLSIGKDENGVGCVFMEPAGDGASFAEAVQNVWLRTDLSAPVFATGAKQPLLELASGVTCKFGAKGVVTLGGKIGTVTVSGRTQTLAASRTEGANACIVVYVANSRLDGGFLCEMVDVNLSDDDGDGKIETVEGL